MQRRIALALALTLTTIATFGVVAVGAQTGMFGDGHATKASTQAAPVAHVVAAAPTEAPPRPTTVVVTDYVYIDDPTRVPEVRTAVAPSATAVPAEVAASPTPAPTATSVPSLAPSSGVPAASAPAPASQPSGGDDAGQPEHQQEPEHEGGDD